MNEDDFDIEYVDNADMLKQWVGDHKSAKHDAELVENGTVAKCRRCSKIARIRG